MGYPCLIEGGETPEGGEKVNVYRIQPRDAELHGVQTETSNGELAEGVHVFETLPELASALAGWCSGEELVELAVIECEGKDVRENGDYEGSLLLKGRGRIVERKPFEDLRGVKEWAEAELGWN